MQSVNAFAAGNRAVRADTQRRAFIWAAVGAKEQPRPTAEPSYVAPASTPATVPTAAPSIDWHCVAIAETGGDVTMHGSTYSTMYGVVNDIVYEYASPEVQARVFAGTASEAEQTDIVARFAADHGTGGWGSLTRSKCGL